MNIVSVVANMQSELDYYKDQCKELHEIVDQLNGKPPKDYEYIHPYDLADLLNNTSYSELVDIYKSNNIIKFAKSGKIYKQSSNMPAKKGN